MGFVPDVSREPARLSFLLGERSRYIPQSKLDNDLWRSTLDEVDIKVVDVYNEICPNGICRELSDRGRYILQDFQHLSLEGARLLKEPIKKKVLSVLNS